MKSRILIIFLMLWAAIGQGQEVSMPAIPALSYHNVRAYSTQNPAYFISPERFEEQIKRLKERGYRTLLPNEVEAVFYEGKQISGKSVLISFDDTRADHYLAAAPILEKYGYRGTFYIMTVSIGKAGYMSREQIRELSDRGHAIGLHTWDHQDLRKLAADQWKIQIDKPKALLEEITKKEVTSLAYPFGLWNTEVIRQIRERELRSAYQLGGKLDSKDPVYSLPRILVMGNWSGDRLVKEIESRF
jgi:peptidoglycan/xylan/chitin deacetylase (PgdA/CDA1 family)